MLSLRLAAAPAARARGRLLRCYTALSRAQFREAPAPASFACVAPTSRSSGPVLSTPVAKNSLLLSAQASSSAASRAADADADADAAATSATYELLLQRLYQVNRFSAVKLGLTNMTQLNAAFGDPAARLEIVHVAGTNGKGSVALKVAKALERSGYRTGLFVSPHVSCFRERIQVNGELISEAQVCEGLSEIFNVSAQLRIPATFFELTTMLALRHFAKQDVDCVVLEVGLGGRLDATNIVTPALSVITSIGMDHMRVLGDTQEAIAREKAGILKPGVPVVVGPNTPAQVLAQAAEQQQAPLTRVAPHAAFADDYNAENTAIAREACVQLNALHGAAELCVDLESSRVRSALEARPPCRFQVLSVLRPNSTQRKVTVVLDVAHNPPALTSLAALLHTRFASRPLRFVCGFSADKDMAEALATISAACARHAPASSNWDTQQQQQQQQQRIHLVKANHPRGASLAEVNLSLAQAGDTRQFDCMASIRDGVEDALAAARAAEQEEVVVVCGSVFVMAEARQALGMKEPVDSAAVTAVAGSHLSTPGTRLAAMRQPAPPVDVQTAG